MLENAFIVSKTLEASHGQLHSTPDRPNNCPDLPLQLNSPSLENTKTHVLCIVRQQYLNISILNETANIITIMQSCCN